MSDYITLSVECIIREARTTKPEYLDLKYVIYFDSTNRSKKVRVNTYYLCSGGKIQLCRYYDGGLCRTPEELEQLDLDYIEAQAYNAYMNGAR